MATLPERMAKVETTLAGLSSIVKETAADVKTIHTFMVGERARRAATMKTLRTVGAVVTGAATCGGAIYEMFGSAIAKIFA